MKCPQCNGTGEVGWDLVNPPEPPPEPAPDAGGTFEVTGRCPLCAEPLQIKAIVDRPLGQKYRTWRIWPEPEICPCVARKNPHDFSAWSVDVEHMVRMAGWYLAQRLEDPTLPADLWTDEQRAKIAAALPA